MAGWVYRTGGRMVGTVTDYCFRCRKNVTVTLLDIARADGVFACPVCGTGEPVREDRLATVARLLRADRERGTPVAANER